MQHDTLLVWQIIEYQSGICKSKERSTLHMKAFLKIQLKDFEKLPKTTAV